MIFFIAMCGLMDGVMPFVSGWVVDNIIKVKNSELLPWYAAAYLVIIVVNAIMIYYFIKQAGSFEKGVGYEMRKQGFAKLQRLSFSYFDKNVTGQILSRVTSDVLNVAQVISWNLVDVSWGIVMMLTMGVLMFITNWQLALYTLAVMPFLYFGAFFFQGKMYKKYKKVREMNSSITASYNEAIMGAGTIKSLGREEDSIEEFMDKSLEMETASVKAGYVSGIFFPYILLLGSVGTAMALGKGGSNVIFGDLSYGTFVTFLFCSVQFYIPIYEMSRAFINLQSARAAGDRFLELMDTPEEIVDNADAHKKDHNIEGEITFENVSFSYIEGEKVLKDFSLNVKKGESIALVGETGSGKSTIVNLACRFYEPTAGRILVDGIDYTELSQESLHSSLGYVLQSPYLFNDTIVENVRYGKPSATMEEVVEACKMVNAHEFILELEKGYETKAGEKGKLLSTGQKQLISLARAVLADPKIFILDEATSSVDTETESIIQKAVDKLMASRTSFIIAHRLTTIVHADRILVIEKGKILEQGSHLELLEKRGHYFKLYTNQFMEEQEALALK